ncbi:DNA-directed RNA polymerase subunit H [uncultured Methanobrevibacter sp.]|uniref:DNA-directed RNA polymerase subunit H n=1 Tax=uncultured Methanobrevibacter sp. TaxID=253161 RepID=UPI0026141AA0
MKFDIRKHNAVPEHEKLSESEKKKIFKNLDYDVSQLPKIKMDDPVIKAMKAEADETFEEGDVIKITRDSETAGEFVTYRVVYGIDKQ